MNGERGINFEMVVELILAIVIGVLFFLPWFGFLGGTYSGAEIFPMVLDLQQNSRFGWTAYSFLLLYLIPLFAVICLVVFLTGRRRAMHNNFVLLCDTTIILLVVLVLVCALAVSNGADYGNALLGMINGMGAFFWVMIGVAVAGLVFAAVAKAMRKPVFKTAEPNIPSS